MTRTSPSVGSGIRPATPSSRRASASSSPQPDVLVSSALRPLLDPPTGWFLSLAHDGGLAVAACARRAVGVDVVPFSRRQQVERTVRAALESRAASGLVAEATPWSSALVLWSAWEAIGKRTGEGVLGAMHERIRPE